MYIPLVVQNSDVDAKKSDYAALKKNELLVSSFFYTIQGEGPWAGLPTFFIRLAGCNYGSKTNFCLGCDTSFALKEAQVSDFQFLLAQTVLSFPLYEQPKVVLTGGEPLLQENVIEFIKLLKLNKIDVQLETNGSQVAAMKHAKAAGAVVVCSPKASHKGYGNKTLITEEHVDCLKFVVTANPKDPHYEVPEWAHTCGVPIYVSPFTVYNTAYKGEVSSAWDHTLVNKELTMANYEYAAKLALENGYRVSIQMHTLLNLA